ncbi:WD domain, G-beta repeat protein [Aphelenchoides besseyi]|nr:WD domain, G-beta repeat protein [Aphelenchoides besseyi]
MVGLVETTTNEPMEIDKPTVEAKKETIIVVQHNWHEVTNSESDETFFVSYRRPGEKSKFFDVKINKKDKTFRSTDVECEKLPYRALKVCFPQLDGLSKTFISPFAEYDQIHKGPVNAIDTNKSGNLVVTSDLNSSTLTVWNSSSGEVLREMADHVLDVNCARFFPSGLVILSGGMDMSIRIWSVERGQSVRVLKGHTAPILDLEFVGNGSNFLSSAKDKTIKRWNCGSGECVTTIQVPRGSVSSLRLNEDESLLLGGSDESCLFIWDTQTKQLVAEVNVHEPCTSISTRNNVVYVGGSNGAISVVDLRQKSLIRTIKVNRGRVHKVLALKSGVLASFADGGVCFYSTTNSTPQSQFEWTGADCDPVYDFAVSGKYLFTACRDKRRKHDLAITSSGDTICADSQTSGSSFPFSLISTSSCEDSFMSAIKRPKVRPPILSEESAQFYTGVQTNREAEIELLTGNHLFVIYHEWNNEDTFEVPRLPLMFLWLDASCEFVHSVVQALGKMESTVENDAPEFLYKGYALEYEKRTFKSLDKLVKYYAHNL